MNIVASLFNLAGGDMIVILLIVLILFGAKRLPELARGLGQAMNEFTKAKDDMQRHIARADEPLVQQPREVQPYRPEEAAAPTQAQAQTQAPAPAPAQSQEQPKPLA